MKRTARRLLRRPAERIVHAVHGGGQGMQAGSVDDLELTEDQLPAGWLLEGAPRLRSAELTTSAHGRFRTGVWDSTAGRYRWHFAFDETVHILEGEVRVTEGDVTRTLRPGDVAYFPMGCDTVWEIPRYVRKLYTHRLPNPVVRLPQRFAA